MARLARRSWVPAACEERVTALAAAADERDSAAQRHRLAALVDENRRIHTADCVNLNPATNLMNPRAEAMLAAGLGNRPSLGYPGDKYEMGLEAIEEIEVITAELAAELFDADYVEPRLASGAMANLAVFMATARPGQTIIAPPAAIGGHVTHHAAGAAGLYGLCVHEATVAAGRFTVDPDALRADARRLRPALITIGGSLNLEPHPVAALRAIADEVGAKLLYDAAHMSGMIAGRAWQQPLAEGAHVMTMSTYKSLGGPAGGLVLTNDPELARRLDAIAFPGLTANFDVGRLAALAVTLTDWQNHGQRYAAAMAASARTLAAALAARGLPVFGEAMGYTRSHQFALEAQAWQDGHALAKRLRQANILTSGIGLPAPAPGIPGALNGLRLGTPEITRAGMTTDHMPELATLMARALLGDDDPKAMAPATTAFRQQFKGVRFID